MAVVKLGYDRRKCFGKEMGMSAKRKDHKHMAQFEELVFL